jgi:hypothetical protein
MLFMFVEKLIVYGELEIGYFKIRCAVLEDGTRVVSEDRMGKAFGRKCGGALLDYWWAQLKTAPTLFLVP